MNPILPPVTSSSSSNLQQQYDDEMYSILPRFEIPDVVLSSTLERESESTSSIDKGEPSLKHAHNHDTDHDANITTKKSKRQHNHDSVHSDTSITHAHVDNDKTITNNSNSSAAEIGSGLRSMKRATAAQDNANNTEKLDIEMCSDVLGKGWLRRYEELIAFKQHHGHCNVPKKKKKDQNKTLGVWVQTQRRQYMFLCNGKPSHMTAERQAALEKIGFEWSLYKDSLWQTRYEELITYKQQNGHCNVPYKNYQNKGLGSWVSSQRYHYGLLCKGKRSSMTAERQAALENIGFEWRLLNKSLWQTRYEELIAFKQQYGHYNVPNKYEQNKSLGSWVRIQRYQYKLKCKGKFSCMTAERQAALEKIGFEWRLHNNSLWQTRYEELIAFKQQHDHCNVPASYAQNKPLGRWVSKQRKHYRFKCKGKFSCMTAERITALEKIGFEWS